jgi:hypothetical protein
VVQVREIPEARSYESEIATSVSQRQRSLRVQHAGLKIAINKGDAGSIVLQSGL